MDSKKIFFGLLFIVLGAACNREVAARRHLESDGYTDVVLTKSGKVFTFTAKNSAGQHCFGDIQLSGGSSTVSSTCNDVCTQAESAKCLTMGLAAEKNNATKSTQYYVTGCEAGDVSCCTNAGNAYDKGIGVTKDQGKSFTYDKKGCDGGEAQGCVNLAIDYAEGEGTPRDLVAAYRAADFACTKANMTGCSFTGRAMIVGEGVPADVIQGADRLDRACKADVVAACANLGMYFVEGAHGVTRDIARGQKLVEDSCTKNDFTACANLGLYLLQKKLTDPDKSKLVMVLAKACDGKNAGGCNSLGYVNEAGLGGLKTDLAAAREKYQTACDLGSGLGCRNAGEALQTKDKSKAAADFDAGCKLGDDKACTERKALNI